MKIEKAEAVAVKMPLKFPFETSYGRQSERETVLVRLFSECQMANPEMAIMSGMPHRPKKATRMVAITLGGSFFTPSGRGKMSKMRAV